MQPGWNAVHLDVQSEPAACGQVFAGQPFESVWKWDRRFTTLQSLWIAGPLPPFLLE